MNEEKELLGHLRYQFVPQKIEASSSLHKQVHDFLHVLCQQCLKYQTLKCLPLLTTFMGYDYTSTSATLNSKPHPFVFPFPCTYFVARLF
jgi:hypothetical protein